MPAGYRNDREAAFPLGMRNLHTASYSLVLPFQIAKTSMTQELELIKMTPLLVSSMDEATIVLPVLVNTDRTG
jgi:hypothetical protein